MSSTTLTDSQEPKSEMNEDVKKTNRQEQDEMPFAIVQGSPYKDVPKDLYIPPEALEVFLEAFEGPLDLLLYLIKRQNIDILDIPIAHITAQYMKYIELMSVMQLELAGEYLLMAAMLAEIKSRMLLPRPVVEEDEEDPRAELVRRLQEYERYKKAAADLDDLPRTGRDVFVALAEFPYKNAHKEPPAVELESLMKAFSEVLARADMYAHHLIQREPLSVRERMSEVLDRVKPDDFIDFKDLFTVEEGKAGVIVALLAILELLRESLIEMVQNEINGPIYVKAARLDPMQQKELNNIIEAALLATDEPLSITRLLNLFDDGEDAPDRAQVKLALDEIEKNIEGSGIELKQVSSGYRFQVRQEYSLWVSRLQDDKPARYSRALLETLAIIAYRQPITRSEIEDIRGVSVSSSIVKTLQERGWVRIVGHRDVPGKPALIATTREFLDYFNLKKLSELPALADIKDFDQMNPDLFEQLVDPNDTNQAAQSEENTIEDLENLDKSMSDETTQEEDGTYKVSKPTESDAEEDNNIIPFSG